MPAQLTPSLCPKDGHVLQVLGIARISTTNQDELSLADQEALYREWLDRNYDGPYELKMIAGQGSGERLDRDEALRAQEELDTGKYDLVIAEDLGRIFRRIHSLLFCESAEDAGTRVIAINDHVDTAQPNWKVSAFFSSIHHEVSNADTSSRIRRSLRNRFENGGIVQGVIYGYNKTPGAKTDDELQKDPEAAPIYDRWFQMLEEGRSFAEIADWLNAIGISPGPSCRNKIWDCRMVGRVTRNPILKGVRERNNRITKRDNKTGRRKTVKAPPSELLTRECPHLAFIEPGRYDRVIEMLNLRNGHFRRCNGDGGDNRKGVSKKRTRYPGQCLFCSKCGEMYVFGGHGQTDHLMCDGARHYHCWIGATVDGPLAAIKLAQAIQQEVDSLESFVAEFIEQLDDEAQKSNAARTLRLRALSQESTKLEREIANVMKLVREGATGPLLNEELVRLEGERRRLALAKAQEEALAVEEIRLPTIEHLKELFRAKFAQLAVDGFEFAAQLRGLAPRIVVFPYRLVDGGPVVLRATFRLQLAELVPDPPTRELLRPTLERVLTVDLFEPPQREKFRAQVVAARRAGETERQIAARLGLTITAVQRAMALQRRMDELGVDDAYQRVTAPPEGGKMRRHKHPRYKFTPRPDAGML